MMWHQNKDLTSHSNETVDSLTVSVRHAGCMAVRGSVALEFLLVFPLMVAMLYAVAAYGIIFFSKYEMQSVVDRAAASSLRVDRNQYYEHALGEEVVARASTVMKQGVATLTARLRERIAGEEASVCAVVPIEDLELLRCALTLDNSEPRLVPQFSFGFLGQFPPQPDSISVEAAVAF